MIASLCRPRVLHIIARVVMQAGFTMLEVGSVGAKHTKNLLVKVRVSGPCAAASYGISRARGTEQART